MRHLALVLRVVRALINLQVPLELQRYFPFLLFLVVEAVICSEAFSRLASII